MLILMFSLAGVPPMLGFFGKFYVLRAAYEGGLAWLAIAGVIASVIGAFYYLRIVYYMYFGEEGEELDSNATPLLWGCLMGSAAIMLVGIINMFGIEGCRGGCGGVACQLTGQLVTENGCWPKSTAPCPKPPELRQP